MERICAKTGLALVSSPVSAFRIARESHGALDPRVREQDEDPADWSRYDTVGRTIYACADELTGYMELLAPYQTEVAERRRALEPFAGFMGVALDELWHDVVTEWDQAGMMNASWLPRVFREGRAIYTLKFPSGWWVDLTAIETIAALAHMFGGSWPTSSGTMDEPLTISHLTSDDRVLTTAIAELLREHVELDDGTLPLGVQFISKRGKPSGGSGLCWAYWMREVDNGLAEPTKVAATEPIKEYDLAFKTALKLCKIKSR